MHADGEWVFIITKIINKPTPVRQNNRLKGRLPIVEVKQKGPLQPFPTEHYKIFTEFQFYRIFTGLQDVWKSWTILNLETSI